MVYYMSNGRVLTDEFAEHVCRIINESGSVMILCIDWFWLIEGLAHERFD